MGSSTFLSVAASLLMALPCAASAAEGDPEFTHLTTGEAAPFEGYLLSPAAVAAVLTTDEERRRKCDADSALALREAAAQSSMQLGERDARVRALTAEAESCATARRDEVAALVKEVQHQRRLARASSIGGFLGGVAIATLVAAVVSAP